MYRIGNGYDIHKLTSGRDLIIGGVKITHEKGLLGHSDADVLIHAIIDSLLGALALADIGTLFPDTDSKYKDIDSTILLSHVYKLVKENAQEPILEDKNAEVDNSAIESIKGEIGQIWKEIEALKKEAHDESGV